tara:strand:- start:234 stop:1019 length:786 start_codon:yes stop_codon:yes gene_type:complete
MIHNNIEMINVLKKLKSEFNIIGIKSSFEDEGVYFNELIKLKELTTITDIDLNIKIGGCEAISDINNCVSLNVNGIIAPMIESEFALSKFINSAKDNLPGILFKKFNFHVNLESRLAYENIKLILSDNSNYKFLTGIVVGRSDMAKSYNLNKSNVDDIELYKIAKDIFKEAKKYKLLTTMGGNISFKSEKFINKLYDLEILDRIETRNIIFDLNKKVINNLDIALNLALSFESLWLRSKSSYYMNISNSYLERANIIDERK